MARSRALDLRAAPLGLMLGLRGGHPDIGSARRGGYDRTGDVPLGPRCGRRLPFVGAGPMTCSRPPTTASCPFELESLLIDMSRAAVAVVPTRCEPPGCAQAIGAGPGAGSPSAETAQRVYIHIRAHIRPSRGCAGWISPAGRYPLSARSVGSICDRRDSERHCAGARNGARHPTNLGLGFPELK